MNVDALKLTVDTLKSVNKERDPVEMDIYAELFRELEEVDLRVSRTRSRSSRGRGPWLLRTHVMRGLESSSTHVRHGLGSASTVASERGG